MGPWTACLTAVTGGTALQGLTAQLEARGAGGDVQLGAGDVLLLHEDLLLHADTLIDEAGVPWDRPVGANLESGQQSRVRPGPCPSGHPMFPQGASLGPGGESQLPVKPSPWGEAHRGRELAHSRSCSESGSKSP